MGISPKLADCLLLNSEPEKKDFVLPSSKHRLESRWTSTLETAARHITEIVPLRRMAFPRSKEKPSFWLQKLLSYVFVCLSNSYDIELFPFFLDNIIHHLETSILIFMI